MSATETKIDAILDAISQDIADREAMANQAMHNLEKMKSSIEEYKDANLQFGANAYVARYLKRIQEVAKDRDIKKVENIIRFHHYQQHTIGALDDHRDISLGQATVAVILGGYVERFFKQPSLTSQTTNQHQPKMEQTTPYRYEAKNDGSYNELAAYAALLMGNVSFFPQLRIIVIDGRFVNDVGKFIDKEGLDFFISPIKIEDNNLINLVNTEAIDSETLRRVTNRIIELSHCAAEKQNNIIAEITAANESVRKDRDYYRELYLKYANKNDRIKEQIRAIGTLVDSIFPKE